MDSKTKSAAEPSESGGSLRYVADYELTNSVCLSIPASQRTNMFVFFFVDEMFYLDKENSTGVPKRNVRCFFTVKNKICIAERSFAAQMYH